MIVTTSRLARITLTMGVAAGLAALAPGAARAQGDGAPPGTAAPDPYVAPTPTVRQGLNIGFGVGGGNLSCDGPSCSGVTEAGSADFQVGTMLRPRLRLLGDIWAMAHTENGFTVTQTLVTGGLQYWIIDRLWIAGGIGGAHATFRYSGPFVSYRDQTESVFGITGGIGYEIVSKPRFSLDAELRVGTGFYSGQDDNAHNEALGVGFTWY